MKKTKYFPFLPEKKTIKVEDFPPYLTTNRPEKYKPTEKLVMDQTNKQRYFFTLKRFENLYKTWY